ncbi:hypothetical protein TRIUR3_09358 [Triticum urartu]|uniref:Uncharacterized protein n=1 Tax=Triticum urartu TaxID=4572 RepID=M7YWG1_TRIUA|nr:hypothetical protein TRIUR3_09358 [Triticum urartu]
MLLPRVVNLLVTKSGGRRPPFDLHRIDPSGLFYPTGSPKPANPAPATARLPSAPISFDWSCPWQGYGFMDFMALNNDIVAVDHTGHTLIYDGASRAVRGMNQMIDPRRTSMSVTVRDALYVMDLRSEVHYFKVFSYGRPPPGHRREEDWYWSRLGPPPLDPDDLPVRHRHPYAVSAYTVVGDSQIWMSIMGAGTYSFDVKNGVWSKAGEWALPFKDRAVYAPEHSLWFGFSASDGKLCAADMTQATAAPARPWCTCGKKICHLQRHGSLRGSTSCRWALASSVSRGSSEELSGGT